MIELTEEDVFTLFADVDRSCSQFKTNTKADYFFKLNSELPSSSVLASSDNQTIDVLLRKYHRK